MSPNCNRTITFRPEGLIDCRVNRSICPGLEATLNQRKILLDKEVRMAKVEQLLERKIANTNSFLSREVEEKVGDCTWVIGWLEDSCVRIETGRRW